MALTLTCDKCTAPRWCVGCHATLVKVRTKATCALRVRRKAVLSLCFGRPLSLTTHVDDVFWEVNAVRVASGCKEGECVFGAAEVLSRLLYGVTQKGRIWGAHMLVIVRSVSR